MAKLASNFINMVFVLTGISLFAAVALGLVYSATQAPIEAAKAEKQQRAIKEVLPAFERLAEPESVEVSGVGAFDVYKAYDREDQLVGAAVASVSKNGFSGEVKIMVGFDKEGAIVNYSVLEQKETPGLGTKMVDWFKPQGEVKKSVVESLFGFEVKVEERKSSIVGKHPSKDNLNVGRDGGEIDAITAATISSRAFLEAVRYAYAAYVNDPHAIDANSSATTPQDSASGAADGAADAASGATNPHAIDANSSATTPQDSASGAADGAADAASGATAADTTAVDISNKN